MANDINSDKIFIKNAFSWWYRVPDYQRPYVWGSDQVTDLLDDVSEWMSIRPDSEYFLGSIVLQERQINGITEYDLLDGQQRLSTCLMIFAVIRDMAKVSQVQIHSKNAVFQQEDTYNETPERLRIIYDIREDVKDFVNSYIKMDGGTNNVAGLQKLKETNNAVRNMANALLEIRNYFMQAEAPKVEDFFRFFWNKVLLVYVSSPDLDDAFRMFTVLNDRGMKLRGSDILKTSNLRAMREAKAGDEIVRKWAQKWEDWEGELGDGFDIFLSQIRSVLVKEKARLSLLQEFDENIYAPRVFDRTTKTYTKRDPLLKRGLETFTFIDRYHNHYQKLILSRNNYALDKSWRFDNLVTLLQDASLADFWLPPLLRYYDVFDERRILDFLKKLEAKFCGDWITYQTPTDRIQSMNKITAAIDEVAQKVDINADEQINQLFGLNVFDYDKKTFRVVLETNDIYSRRFARYLLFKLDTLYASPDERLQLGSNMSVEHVLPQTPHSDSQWCKDFTSEERDLWTNRLGNLVLIGRRKNSSQGRADYGEKKEKYFKNNVETFPNSVRVMQNKIWDLNTLKNHHKEVIDLLCS